MKKHIIFLENQYLNKRNFKRFMLNFFLKKGWVVEYWNCQNLIYKKKIVFDKFYIPNKSKFKVYNFDNFFTIFQKILKRKYVFYIDYSNQNFIFNFFRLLFLYGKNKRILLDISCYPNHKLSYLNLYNIFKSINFFLFIQKSLKFTFLYFKKISIDKFFYFKPLIHFTAGLKSRLDSENLYGKGLQIKAHVEDYNTYLKPNKNLEIFNNKIVFLDQDFPVPFELDIRKGKKFINRDNYWNSINNFLDFLEKKLKKKAVIAAHPRAMKSRNISKKRIIFDHTNELIKHSAICLGHTSNAIQFCILHQKPLLIIATNDFINNKDVAVFQDMHALAIELNKNIINIDNFKFNDLKKELLVNVKEYKSYINKYIKEENSQKINSWVNLEKVLSNYITKG